MSRQWCMNDWEAERLRGLSVFAQLMYVMGYKARCDYKSGVFSACMSYRAWWELLGSVPSPGSRVDWNERSGLPDFVAHPKRFMNFIVKRRDELIRAGLLSKRSSYVYFLPVYADSALFRPDLEVDEEGDSTKTILSGNSMNNKESSNLEVDEEGGSTKTPHTTSTTSRRVGDFCMDRQWMPGDGFAGDALASGFDVADKHRALFDAALVDMRLYWLSDSSRAGVLKNQFGWELALLKTMKQLYKWHLQEKRSIQSSAKPSAASGDVKAIKGVKSDHGKGEVFIKPVPRDFGGLDAWFKQYAALGAPAAKNLADYGYAEWSRDLNAWRTNAVRRGTH